IALHQAEFPPDHLVERAGVADDVYLLDIDARSLVDLEDDVDRIVFAVAGDARMHLCKRVALGAAALVSASTASWIRSASLGSPLWILTSSRRSAGVSSPMAESMPNLLA